jgi:hypothetical protein
VGLWIHQQYSAAISASFKVHRLHGMQGIVSLGFGYAGSISLGFGYAGSIGNVLSKYGHY